MSLADSSKFHYVLFFFLSQIKRAADKNLNEKNGPASKQLTMSTSPSSNSDTPSSSSPSSADDATDQMLQDENAQTPSELTDEPDSDRLDHLDSSPKQVTFGFENYESIDLKL